MKTIGLIGGMSWESTVTYYRALNEQINRRLGGYHSARCLLYSVDFAEIEAYQRAGHWERAGEALADAARSLEKGGAELILIATNTMHKVFSQVQQAVETPLVHIAAAAAEAILAAGLTRVSLLGTKYTMEQDFYKARLRQAGVNVLIPPPEDREIVNHIIFNELCLGKVLASSRAVYQRIIEDLAVEGAQGVLLGIERFRLGPGLALTAVFQGEEDAREKCFRWTTGDWRRWSSVGPFILAESSTLILFYLHICN